MWSVFMYVYCIPHYVHCKVYVCNYWAQTMKSFQSNSSVRDCTEKEIYDSVAPDIVLKEKDVLEINRKNPPLVKI